ncbi:MAG: 1,2-phenylacetyl-CoA epoxidase subunit PaaD [Planctomycetota bacterium]|jgi:ring-1,2-phenylacetyl-CoA epoxidase subunit PaaD
MVQRQEIIDALQDVPDPEMPISIVELGLVERVDIDGADDGDAKVSITLLPTFVGCPALDMIKGDVVAKVGGLDGVREVHVDYVFDPPWSVDRISDAGRAALREHGVTVPKRGGALDLPGHRGEVRLQTSAIACPFCSSRSVFLDSPFGPTRCRMIYYCDACGNSFEHMKRLEG